MRLALVAAASENDVIGRGGDLPWHLPEDLRRFKALTTGHIVIMGRKTYASVGRPLPNRTNIVVTTQSSLSIEGADVCTGIDDAIEHARSLVDRADQEVFIVGGEALYRAALPAAQRVYLTRVHAMVDGDTFFPRLDDSWTLTAQEFHASDDVHAHPFSFQIWDTRTATD